MITQQKQDIRQDNEYNPTPPVVPDTLTMAELLSTTGATLRNETSGGIKSTRHKTLSHHHKQTTEGTFSASIVWLQTAALVERGELLFTLCFPCRFKQRAIKLYRGHCLFLYTNAVLRVKDVRNNLSTPSDILMYSLCLLLSPSGSRALNKNDLHHTDAVLCEEDGADQQSQPFYTTENYTNVS